MKNLHDFSEFSGLSPKGWENVPRGGKDDILSTPKKSKPFLLMTIGKVVEMKGNKFGKKGYRMLPIQYRLLSGGVVKQTVFTADTVIEQVLRTRKNLPYSCTFWYMKGGKFGKYATLKGAKE